MTQAKIDTTTAEYQSALKFVHKKREFFSHLVSYVCVVGFLFLLNLITSPYHWWFYWVGFFWGIGLLIHALQIFVLNGMYTKNWEEKEVAKILNIKN